MSQNIPDGCIPFDFEKYKAGHPARTRDGRSIKFACHSPTHPEETGRVMSMLHDGTWTLSTDGGLYIKGACTINDIFLVAPEIKWIPWDNVDEVPDAWFRHKDSGYIYRPVLIDPLQGVIGFGAIRMSLSSLFNLTEWHRCRSHKGPWNVCGKVKP